MVLTVKPGEYDAQKYNLTASQAFQLSILYGMSRANDKQVLLRWLRQGIVDAVKIITGPQNERGYRVSKQSLLRQIMKNPDEREQLIQILQQRFTALQAQLEILAYAEIGMLEQKANTAQGNQDERNARGTLETPRIPSDDAAIKPLQRATSKKFLFYVEPDVFKDKLFSNNEI